jgi:serine/threonine-protein kinase RsbW
MVEKKEIKHFVIGNRIGELPVLAEKIEKLAEKWELPMSLTININLVLEEALSNVIFYAFNDNLKHKIRISTSINNKILTIKIKDDGIPFDPTSRQLPDITLPAEERPTGGLGIFLISKIMDKIHYSRKKELNILTLTKHI